VLSLLPVYHRIYDAMILTLPMAWAAANLCSTRRTIPILVAILLLIFIAPVSIAEDVKHFLPSADRYPMVWQAVAISLRSWVLLVMCIALLFEASRRPRADPMADPSSKPDSLSARALTI